MERTRFVIGGYSRGATVVVDGNPLGMIGRTIAGGRSRYGAQAKECCDTGARISGS